MLRRFQQQLAQSYQAGRAMYPRPLAPQMPQGQPQGLPAQATVGVQQLVRTYHGKHLERDFERDAKRLARQGWIAGTPAYGGQQRIGLGSFLWSGFRASRKPSTCTVVYTRPAR